MDKTQTPLISIFKFLSNWIILIITIFALTLSCSEKCPKSQILHDTVFVYHNKSLIKLTVDSVRVDTVAISDLSGNKMIDGVLAFENGEQTRSRWAVPGYPHYAMFYFSYVHSVNKIKFNLFKGDQGYTNHIKFYNFSDLIWEGDVGDSLWNNIYLNFYGSAIFLEITGPSKKLPGKTNNWTDIGEIEFYGFK